MHGNQLAWWTRASSQQPFSRFLCLIADWAGPVATGLMASEETGGQAGHLKRAQKNHTIMQVFEDSELSA